MFCCTKTFIQNELFTVICVTALVYYLSGTAFKLMDYRSMEIYNHTGSASQESLEIVLCPMPRVHVGRILHLGKYIHNYLYYEFTNNFLRRSIKDDKAMLKLKTVVKCLIRKKEIKLTNRIDDILHHLAHTTSCWDSTEKERSQAAIQVALRRYDLTWNKDLFRRFRMLDEKLIAEYTKIFEQAWMLQFENMTLQQYMDVLSIKLQRYIDDEQHDHSFSDATGPRQSLSESTIETRFASCMRHMLRDSADPGFQRSEIVYAFRTDCSEEEMKAFPRDSLCLPAEDLYIVIYVTSMNHFTDALSAATIVPLRLAIDADSILHVSVTKKEHGLQECEVYGHKSSYVTCVEQCLVGNVLLHIKCIVPWIERRSKYFPKASNLPYCNTSEAILATSKEISRTYDSTIHSNCSTQCKKDCGELTVLPRLMGSVSSPEPKLMVLISDEMPVFTEEYMYGVGQFVSEVMGSLSFIIGVSVVVLYDWLLGVALWMMGKLPFIPAMPPLLKHEVYTAGMCRWKRKCPCWRHRGDADLEADDEADEEEDVMTAEEDSILAESFKTHRGSRRWTDRSSVGQRHRLDSQVSRHSQTDSSKHFPAISVRPSAMHTMALALGAGSSGRVAASRQSLAQRRTSLTPGERPSAAAPSGLIPESPSAGGVSGLRRLSRLFMQPAKQQTDQEARDTPEEEAPQEGEEKTPRRVTLLAPGVEQEAEAPAAEPAEDKTTVAKATPTAGKAKPTAAKRSAAKGKARALPSLLQKRFSSRTVAAPAPDPPAHGEDRRPAVQLPSQGADDDPLAKLREQMLRLESGESKGEVGRPSPPSPPSRPSPPGGRRDTRPSVAYRSRPRRKTAIRRVSQEPPERVETPDSLDDESGDD